MKLFIPYVLRKNIQNSLSIEWIANIVIYLYILDTEHETKSETDVQECKCKL